MCRSPTRRTIPGTLVKRGPRRSKSSPRADLPKHTGETIASSTEFLEELTRFGLGNPPLLGQKVRHPFDRDRFAFPSAGHHRINPAGPPFDNGKTRSGPDQQKGTVLLDDVERRGGILSHCRPPLFRPTPLPEPR